GQFAPEKRWSVCSGKQPKSNRFIGGQFAPESGGQFDRILQFLSYFYFFYFCLTIFHFAIIVTNNHNVKYF
ncbi:MAG: hypothetical protein ABSD71_07955, partial [Bacteroidales bacterium]